MTQPLRDYQVDLIAQIEAAIAQGHRRIMLQLPTGAGKTRCFVELVKNHRFAPYADGVYNCLIIAHRTELIDQAKKYLKQELRDTSYIHIGIIKAGRELSPRCSIQVASIQTLNSKLERKQWVPPAGLVIIDEAHHATAKSYQKAIEHYSNAIILGVTATPIRTDGKGFKDSFDILIKGPSISELTVQQHLCPFRLFAYYTQRINLLNVSTRAGDFDLHQLAEAVITSEVRADLVKTWEQYARGKRTVVFAVNIELSKEYAKAYYNAGYAAAHVDGGTPDDEREKILERFRKGETQILCNYGIVTEGFDLQEIECVQVVRPTKSLSLWLQMVGRSLRYVEGKTAIILEHTDNYERLGLPDAERNWTLEGIDRNSKPLELKGSIRDRDKELLHQDGELFEVYSNLENAKTTLEIPLIVKGYYELQDQVRREGGSLKQYKFPYKGGRKKLTPKGEEEIKDKVYFLFVGNLVKVEGVGEFLIKGDIYFYKSFDYRSGGQYILYWTITNGELVDQQLDNLSSLYRSKFEKILESQIEAKKLELEAKRLAKDRKNAEIQKILRGLCKEDSVKEIIPKIPVIPIINKNTVTNFAEDLGGGIELYMIAIPGGNFQMGDNNFDFSKPLHPVSINPFYLAKYPITQKQYQAVMGTNPSAFKGTDDSLRTYHPVECVSWHNAVEFCQKLSQKTGKNYCLPSEAEWEYACRAGTQTKYYFGDDQKRLEIYAWYCDNSKDETQMVWQKKPNQFGLYDMHGNVWEWCSDYWHSNYQNAPTDGSSWETGTDDKRVQRGGSWYDSAVYCRSAYRYRGSADTSHDSIGFRVALALA